MWQAMGCEPQCEGWIIFVADYGHRGAPGRSKFNRVYPLSFLGRSSRWDPERTPLLDTISVTDHDVSDVSSINSAELAYTLRGAEESESRPSPDAAVTEATDFPQWKWDQGSTFRSTRLVHSHPYIFTRVVSFGSMVLWKVKCHMGFVDSPLLYAGVLGRTLHRFGSPQDYPEALAGHILQLALKSHEILSIMSTQYEGKRLSMQFPTKIR